MLIFVFSDILYMEGKHIHCQIRNCTLPYNYATINLIKIRLKKQEEQICGKF